MCSFRTYRRTFQHKTGGSIPLPTPKTPFLTKHWCFFRKISFSPRFFPRKYRFFPGKISFFRFFPGKKTEKMKFFREKKRKKMKFFSFFFCFFSGKILFFVFFPNYIKTVNTLPECTSICHIVTHQKRASYLT